LGSYVNVKKINKEGKPYKDTRAVMTPVAAPIAKDPLKNPRKTPRDLSRALPSNVCRLSPSGWYATIDLLEGEKDHFSY